MTRFGCTQSTVVSRLHSFDYRSADPMDPHVLTMRFTRISTCQSLSFLARLARSFWKTWLPEMKVGLYDPNAPSAVWLLREEPSRQAKSNVRLKEVLICRFWDSMLHYELLPQGHTVTALLTPLSSRNSQRLFGKSCRGNHQCSFTIMPYPM